MLRRILALTLIIIVVVTSSLAVFALPPGRTGGMPVKPELPAAAAMGLHEACRNLDEGGIA
ncbi:MAG: hypothetical protein NUK57_08615, partial [Gudongella sp.]|nr:hypothetical protein [Gudongella sp.]